MKSRDHFWLAVLVIGGYLLFGAAASFVPIIAASTIFVNTVLSTMGPLVGWVVKAWFDEAREQRAADGAP